VVRHDALAHHEAEAVPVPGLLGGEERLEDSLEIRWDNTDPGVRDANADAAVLLAQLHAQLAAAGHRVGGVQEQIQEQLLEPLRIAVDGDRPIGILSERDIVREAAHNEKFFMRVVADLMTRDVITGQPHDDLPSVAHTMTERRIRHLPVVDKGRLVGMVSIGDIVKAQRDHYQGEVDTLQTQLLADERGRAI